MCVSDRTKQQNPTTELDTAERNLQIFEVFQIFKRPPGDSPDLIVVEEPVGNINEKCQTFTLTVSQMCFSWASKTNKRKNLSFLSLNFQCNKDGMQK